MEEAKIMQNIFIVFQEEKASASKCCCILVNISLGTIQQFLHKQIKYLKSLKTEIE